MWCVCGVFVYVCARVYVCVLGEATGDASAPPPATAVWELHYCHAHITFKTLADGVHVLSVTPSIT